VKGGWGAVRRARALVAALLSACLLCGTAVAETRVSLTFLGDCTIGCEERLMNAEYGFAKVAAREGYGYFFAKVLPLLQEDDLTIANFEGVLKPDAGIRANKTYCFRGLPEYAAILSQGSVEVASLANNHTGDYGKTGYRNTWDALAAAGVQPVDTANPYVVDIRGVKIGVVSIYAAGYFAKRQMMKDAVKKAQDLGADAVVCMVHAGQEYDGLHSRNQTLIARLLIDSGADVVIGTHPHVLQGTEVYGQRSVLYSIGNFVFGGNATVRSNETVVARVTLTFDDSGVYAGQQVRLYAANISGEEKRNNYQPVLVTGEAAQAAWRLIDRDSEGQPAPAVEADGYRDYAYLPAAAEGVAP
jgi:poly-gamma-glutamate synthesis protein (capsule biosynthesis protein)